MSSLHEYFPESQVFYTWGIFTSWIIWKVLFLVVNGGLSFYPVPFTKLNCILFFQPASFRRLWKCIYTNNFMIMSMILDCYGHILFTKPSKIHLSKSCQISQVSRIAVMISIHLLLVDSQLCPNSTKKVFRLFLELFDIGNSYNGKPCFNGDKCSKWSTSCGKRQESLEYFN